MAFILKDRVKETTCDTGTRSYYILCGAVSGYQGFSAVGSTNETFYTVTDGTNWETGSAVYCTDFGNELYVCSVLASSNSGSAVNWAAGEKDIFLSYPAERAAWAAGSNIASTQLGVGALVNNAVLSNNNTAIGRNTLNVNTTGQRNTAVGSTSLRCNIAGCDSVAVGYLALFKHTCSFNTSVGSCTSLCGTTATLNTVVGFNSMRLVTTGSCNVTAGACALYNVTTGTNNIGIGVNAGRTGGTPAGIVNLTTETDRIVMGNDSHICAQIKIAWTVTSDCRDKACLKDVPHGLDFVRALKPVEYQFKKGGRESTVTDGKRRYGFLAQDILPLEGEDPVVISTENPGKLQYTEAHMTPILVKAVQELASKIEIFETRLDALENA